MTAQKFHQAEVRGVSYSADGRYVASAGFDKNIVIADTLDLNKVSIVKALEHDDKVVSVRWHPLLPLLLSTSADKSARIWSPQLRDERDNN
jgi:WD40 repeat protein